MIACFLDKYAADLKACEILALLRSSLLSADRTNSWTYRILSAAENHLRAHVDALEPRDMAHSESTVEQFLAKLETGENALRFGWEGRAQRIQRVVEKKKRQNALRDLVNEWNVKVPVGRMVRFTPDPAHPEEFHYSATRSHAYMLNKGTAAIWLEGVTSVVWLEKISIPAPEEFPLPLEKVLVRR